MKTIIDSEELGKIIQAYYRALNYELTHVSIKLREYADGCVVFDRIEATIDKIQQ